jgi:hypothetical protein
MEYEIRKVVEEVDIISLSVEEYAKINGFYREIISKRFPRLAELKQIYDIQRMILTDGLSRIEVVVSANGKIPNTDTGFERPIPNDLK